MQSSARSNSSDSSPSATGNSNPSPPSSSDEDSDSCSDEVSSQEDVQKDTEPTVLSPLSTAPLGPSDPQNSRDSTENLTEQEYIERMQQWTVKIPIGLGLCPWASKAHHHGNIRYVVCGSETSPAEIEQRILQEGSRLRALTEIENEDSNSFHTTLLICPNVNEWNNDFEEF